MIYSLLIFNHSNLNSVSDFIENDIIPEIKTNYSDLSIELLDETDNRYAVMCDKHINRFPVYILIKNNKRKTIKYSNFSKISVISWLNSELLCK